MDAPAELPHARPPPAQPDALDTAASDDIGSCGSIVSGLIAAAVQGSPAAAAAAAASCGTLSTCGGLSGEGSAAPPDREAGRAADGRDGAGADADKPPPRATLQERPAHRRLSDLRRLQCVLDGCNSDRAVQEALLCVAPLCRPSKATLTKLISKYSKTGLWRRGLALFTYLHLLDVDMDLSLGNAALWACNRGGDAVQAWHVFCDMQTRLKASTHSAYADAITYRALLPVLHSHGMWELCVSAYTVAFRQGTCLDGQACLFLLCALRRAGLWQLAEACLLAELAQQLHLEPFTALAAAIAQAPPLMPHGDAAADAACGLLQAVRELGSAHVDGGTEGLRAPEPEDAWGACGYAYTCPGHTCSPDDRDGHELAGVRARGLAGDALATQCCNVLLRAYAEATPPQPARALAFLYAMSRMSTVSRTGDLRPDIVAYGLVALAHFRAGLTANGLDVLNACARSLQPATAAAYAQCLATAAGTGDAAAAAALWRHMAALGVQPDDACHAAFIAAASRSRLPGLCVEAVTQVHALSAAACASPPLQEDIGRLLVFLAQHGPAAHAVTAFQSVLGARIRVSPEIVSECVLALAWRDALCCVSLRQTAAAAGFVCCEALMYA